MTKHTTKMWKKVENPNFLLNWQNSLFQSFPTFQQYDLSNDFILKFSKLILDGKQNLVQALYLEIKPLKSTLSAQGENTKIAFTQKALDQIL